LTLLWWRRRPCLLRLVGWLVCLRERGLRRMIRPVRGRRTVLNRPIGAILRLMGLVMRRG
jgi:hypothetical protein